MPQVSIEDKLKSIKSWNFVPGKNKILPVLKTLLNDNEFIIDIIDGFFPGDREEKKSNDDSGFILVTDRIIVLMRSDKPEKYSSLNKSTIKSITCVKNFSSLTINIDSGKEQFSFVTHLSEAAVKNIFSAAGKPVERENFKSADTMNRSAGSASYVESAQDSSHPAVADFLTPEIKKINTRLEEFMKAIPDPNFMEMYRDDIYTLSGLCGMTGSGLSDNEILFMCMATSAGEEKTSADEVNPLDEVMATDSYPFYLRESINRKMETVISGINRMNKSTEKNLKSLEYLIKHDIEHDTKYADKMASLFYEYSQCLLKADGVLDGDEELKLKSVSELIQKISHSKVTSSEKPVEGVETIEQVMEKINALVGMDNIKDEIKSFINFVSIRGERDKRKLPVTPLSLHAVFYGPPGTGKTTIARLLGRVYKALGLLQSGHLIETDRAGLVAGFVGQTAIKTDELVTKAKDGVLFIDEAYTLVPENSSNDFGRESIDTILKRMEDMREGFAVIAAGYTDEMERFIDSNPGLKSRFSRYFYFNHYTPEELLKIFNIFADNVEFKLSSEAESKLKELITHFYNIRSKSFGNARFVRNVFDKIVQNQADRLASLAAFTDELLCEVTVEDIPRKEDFSSEQFS